MGKLQHGFVSFFNIFPRNTFDILFVKTDEACLGAKSYFGPELQGIDSHMMHHRSKILSLIPFFKNLFFFLSENRLSALI